MPPRRQLHELASVVAEGTSITDSRKQTFVIEKVFAKGGFGRIYSGRKENDRKFGGKGSLAIKIEPHANGPLFTEINVFQRILKQELFEEWLKQKELQHLGLPPYVSSGLLTYKGEKLRFLAMPRYERSLEVYRQENGGVLGLQNVLTIARQCVNSLSFMQEHDFVHGDLKAENILLASERDFSRCFLVDFGLARMAKTNVNKPDKKKAHNGTMLFTSIDAHRGYSPSYRGDLEILAYNIVYWCVGSLPWQNFTDSPETVMLEKVKFLDEIETSIKKYSNDEFSNRIIKIFQISQKTPYTTKVDYGLVQELLKYTPKAPSLTQSSSKRSKTEVSVSKGKSEVNEKVAENIIPKKKPVSRKRKQKIQLDDCKDDIEIEDPGTSNKRTKSASLIKRDGVSKRKTIKSSVPTSNAEACSSADKSDSLSSDKHSVSLPRRKPQKTSDDNCSTNSPGALLKNIIPGTRNMKTVRRSLKDSIAKKYVKTESCVTGSD